MNTRDFFSELGVKPLINAAGTYTSLTASLMLPEVVEAMNYASKSFVVSVNYMTPLEAELPNCWVRKVQWSLRGPHRH